MNKRWLAMLGALAVGGCFLSPSPVKRAYPILEPGAKIAPDRVGRIEGLPDLPDKGEVTLAQVLEVAFSRNPDIARARAAWGASSAAITAAGSLPDPMIRFTHLPEPVQTRTGEQRQKIMVMQKIPFPLTLVGRSTLASEKARADWIRYDRAV
ncbi:MAG: hypothetical protein ACYTFG_03830, partial [Planctomycetota bacterium]